MGNIFAVYKPILLGVMKLAGLRPRTLEIEPGTVMNFWVPTETDSKKPKPAVLLEAMVISDEDFTVANYPQRVHLIWGENDRIFDIETASDLIKCMHGSCLGSSQYSKIVSFGTKRKRPAMTELKNLQPHTGKSFEGTPTK